VGARSRRSSATVTGSSRLIGTHDGSYGDLMMDLSGGTRVMELSERAWHVFERASYASGLLVASLRFPRSGLVEQRRHLL